jgi:dipeptidyl aminopeptidase/acylaminoacyl peptidase
VVRQNAQEPQRLWYTRDFTTWTQVTDARPEPRGLPQELLTWRMFDGTTAQGILYKPVDYDPRKRYPVILNFYERQTNLYYDSFIPADGVAGLDPVAITRAGYLLFLPDIHFTLGAPGESIYNAVVSGARHLTTLPFVDGKRMGIISGSFGGYAVNYLVTRTSLFAAAVASCGLTNLFTQYGEHELSEVGRSNAAQIEVGQYRIGVTPWDRLDLYFENSPIFRADKITTPLLLYHNYNDYVVQVAQSMEMFKALRRLGKRVWLLAGSSGHCGSAVDLGFPYLDQFFGHYLKGAPAPKWMTSGVPAVHRGLDTGFEPDSGMTTPGPGLVLQEEVRTPQQRRLVSESRR